MVMDSLHGFSLHVTTRVVGPYHCPSQKEYAVYVAWLAGFRDNANARKRGDQAAQEEAMEEDVTHDGDGDEDH